LKSKNSTTTVDFVQEKVYFTMPAELYYFYAPVPVRPLFSTQGSDPQNKTQPRGSQGP